MTCRERAIILGPYTTCALSISPARCMDRRPVQGSCGLEVFLAGKRVAGLLDQTFRGSQLPLVLNFRRLIVCKRMRLKRLSV